MGETANGRGKLREGVSADGRIGVVEGNGASWARLGARFGLANSESLDTRVPLLSYYGLSGASPHH